MSAIVVLVAITAIAGLLLGGFVALCGGIRRVDKYGIRRPETLAPHRDPLFAYTARWNNDNTPALT
jgi:hypothetical protein